MVTCPRSRAMLVGAVALMLSAPTPTVALITPSAVSRIHQHQQHRQHHFADDIIQRTQSEARHRCVPARSGLTSRRHGRSTALLRMTAPAAGEDGESLPASSGAISSTSTGGSTLGGGIGGAVAAVAAEEKREHDQDEEETAISLDKALEEGVNRAMRGDPAVLRQVLSQDAEWRGPLGQNVGLAAIEAELRGLGQLLSEPKLSVFSAKNAATELEWIGSGTWSLPWLPRFIVRGQSVVETGPDGKVVKITDTWEGNLLSLAFKHLLPGFWDFWHQLGSPPAEQQPYKVLKNTGAYEIREYAPRLVLQPSVIDRSNSREIRMALIIPGFAHNGNLRTSGRKPDEYYVTEPVEVAIQPFIETGFFPNGTWFNGTVKEASTSRRANRITWTVPVPTAMGLDVTTLPRAAGEREPGEGQKARYAKQGFRRVAATNFNGLPQDPEAAGIRTTLLKQLEADGVVPNKGEDGRIRSGIMMHNARACFNRGGRLAMSILYHRPKYIGIGNEVFVELDDDADVTEAFVEGEGEESTSR